jgi:hypothetical protein
VLGRPAFVPRTTGRRQEMTGTAGASNRSGQEPDSGIAAGSEIGPENTLKVETRVQIPLGLPRQTCRSQAKFGATSATELAISGPTDPANIPRQVRTRRPRVRLVMPDGSHRFALDPVMIGTRRQGSKTPPAPGGDTPRSSDPIFQDKERRCTSEPREPLPAESRQVVAMASWSPSG